MAGSAQCRSSMTRIRGPRVATSWRKRRHAMKDSSRLAAVSLAVANPTSGASRAFSHSRSEASSATARTAASNLAAPTPGSSDSRMPAWALMTSPRAQKPTASPKDRQRPRRQATSSGWASTKPASSRTSRLLPNPGLAEDRDQLHGVLAERLPVAALQGGQLLTAADQRRRGPLGHIHARPAAGPQHPKDRQRLGLAFHLDRGELVVGEQRPGGPPGRLPDNHPVDRRHSLQPRRRVHHVADHAFAVSTAGKGDKRLAGVDADPHRQLRVVFVDRRDAEHGHDRIPDELVEGAADALDLTAQPAVEGA